MNAGPVTLETLAADQHFDRQIAIVREHWGAVWRLWLGRAERLDVETFHSSLPSDFWIGCGMPGLANIRPTRDGHFEFAEDGLTAVIIPAYDTIPGNLDANPEAHVEHLVDLVAVDVDHPDRHWRRRGEALLLGAAYLDLAAEYGEPISVFRTPLTWLKSGGVGITILDWSWVPHLLLGHELIAEDIALGTRLETALAPSILVMEAA